MNVELTLKFMNESQVPATKLAALQKVLQSEFLNAVREVYEHVYETVDVEGSPDIRLNLLYIEFVQSNIAPGPVPQLKPQWPRSLQPRVTLTPEWWSCPRQRRGWAST